MQYAGELNIEKRRGRREGMNLEIVPTLLTRVVAVEVFFFLIQ